MGSLNKSGQRPDFRAMGLEKYDNLNAEVAPCIPAVHDDDLGSYLGCAVPVGGASGGLVTEHGFLDQMACQKEVDVALGDVA